MPHDRRRVPRLLAGWHGRYALDDRPDDGWYSCRVIDIALGGAALELFGPAPLEDAGVDVDVHAAPFETDLHLHAKARYMIDGTGSGTRVGIEWDELTGQQTALLNSLLKLTYRRAS